MALIHRVPGAGFEVARRYAARLAQLLLPGDMVTLRGEVGMGKTSFAQALIGAISPDNAEVTSPTFTLMQSYPCVLASGARETVWHLDLYRLEEAQEARALGLEEIEPHIVLMEWPEVIEHTLPQSRLDITFTQAAEDTRDIGFAGNDAWRKRLETLW